jgi:ribosomal protein L7/L12
MNSEMLLRFREMTDRELIQVAARLAVNNIEMFELLCQNETLPKVVIGFTTICRKIKLTEETLETLRSLAEKNKIFAIKEFRTLFDLPLKEAKDAFDLLGVEGFLGNDAKNWWMHTHSCAKIVFSSCVNKTRPVNIPNRNEMSFANLLHE